MDPLYSEIESNDFSSSELNSKDYLNCALCGQALVFTHKIDYMNLSVKEEAHCACCQVRLKARDHKMQ